MEHAHVEEPTKTVDPVRRCCRVVRRRYENLCIDQLTVQPILVEDLQELPVQNEHGQGLTSDDVLPLQVPQEHIPDWTFSEPQQLRRSNRQGIKKYSNLCFDNI